MRKKKPTVEDALRLLAQLDYAEQDELFTRIVSDRDAPLHNNMDMLLKTCLHAMKAAVRVFVSFRDKPSNGGRLWAATLFRGLKDQMGWGWAKLYKNLVADPDAVRAVRVVSPGYAGRALTHTDQERVRKAIRDLERHAKAKAEKADAVYQLVRIALPPEFRAAFPGIESYLKIF
jgi:hypothetical protein